MIISNSQITDEKVPRNIGIQRNGQKNIRQTRFKPKIRPSPDAKTIRNYIDNKNKEKSFRRRNQQSKLKHKKQRYHGVSANRRRRRRRNKSSKRERQSSRNINTAMRKNLSLQKVHGKLLSENLKGDRQKMVLTRHNKRQRKQRIRVLPKSEANRQLHNIELNYMDSNRLSKMNRVRQWFKYLNKNQLSKLKLVFKTIKDARRRNAGAIASLAQWKSHKSHSSRKVKQMQNTGQKENGNDNDGVTLNHIFGNIGKSVANLLQKKLNKAAIEALDLDWWSLHCIVTYVNEYYIGIKHSLLNYYQELPLCLWILRHESDKWYRRTM